MDDRQHAAAMTDERLERDLARALAVEPSPEFVARVRTRIASEPAPKWAFGVWIVPAIGAVAAVIALAVVVANRSNRSEHAAVIGPLDARAVVDASTLPQVESGLKRTARGPAEAGRPVRSTGPASVGPYVLLDPRETAALRSLIAGVRNNTVNLTPLLQPAAPSPMELPPVADLVIAPLAIELLAPQDGAPGERQ